MKTKPAKQSPGVKSSLHPKRWAADVLNQVEQLSGEEKFPKALELLLPLLRQFPHEITVLRSAVDLFDKMGMPYHRTFYLQHAADIDPTMLLDLAQSCAGLGLTVLSMQALRRMMKYIRDTQEIDKLRTLLSMAESDIQPVIRAFALNQRSGEEGLRFMEEAQIALHMQDYTACIQLNLQSAKNLKNFPPPLNNLSLAYFSTGQWKRAIQITRGVLESRSNDFQAQANLIHFLAWTGGLTEAQSLWKQIRKTQPTDKNTRRKLIETAAIIEDDEVVYELLHTQKTGELDQQARFYLAVAEANLGKSGVRKKLSRLATEGYPGARESLTALKNGKKGRGYSERFAYKQAAEFLPEELRSLYTQADGSGDQAGLSKRIKERVARYPQLILAAKKLIYEEEMAEAGCQLLIDIATPESFATLRDFGTGQIGGKQARMHALNQLLDAGQIENGSTMQFWDEDKWTDIELRRIRITDEDDRPYSRSVKIILDQGLRLYQQGKHAEAEKKFLQALQLEPKAKEALNNLGTCYFQDGQVERGLDYFRQALEIDPLYLMPRCNLANHLITENRLEEAQAMIQPLHATEKATSQGMAFLSYTRARIAFLKEEYEEAQNQAEMALRMNPQLESAQSLLNQAKVAITVKQITTGGFFARRDELRARAREKLREKLTTPTPSILDVLAIYSREILQSITRKWAPNSGWSTYKKAPLLEYLQELMLDPYHSATVIANLETDEKAALQFILGKGGSISWEEFSSLYDNDLEESPYWQYHDPKTLMGRLRSRCLLVEVTVEGRLLLAIPMEFQLALQNHL